MARILLSYSRVDRRFVGALADKLRRIYGHDNVWFDEGLHGGDIWWEEILEQIKTCEIFIYVLSNDSVQSDYCQAEFTEARRLQKQIITVQARDRTRLTEELGDIHYINMANGVDDADALTDLFRSINKQMTKVPRRAPKPLWEPATPKPGKVDEKPRPTGAPDVDTPTLEVPRSEHEKLRAVNIPWWKKPEFIIGAVLIPIFAAVLGAVIENLPDPLPPTSVAQVTIDEPDATKDTNEDDARATGEAHAYASLTALAPTDTPTITPTPTDTPISFNDIQQTAQAEIFATETVAARTQAVIARETQSIVLTGQFSAASTATYVAQLSLTPLVTNTSPPTNTLTNTRTVTPTRDPLLQATFRPVTRNARWTPVERDFSEVTMVLVPAGCFEMGSTDDDSDEQPVHEQCFDQPFWIDKFEVTQAQFRRLGGIQAIAPRFAGDNYPVERITWFEAHDFCKLRDGRLPTEAEWEYAARGPDNLVYPWGNTWIENQAVWNRSSTQETKSVGSIAAGISWVGALDMSGNVWEWTSSLYESYPYDAGDGREADTGSRTDVRRVLRGGEWDYYGSGGLRAANRSWYFPFSRFGNFGFRCARSYD